MIENKERFEDAMLLSLKMEELGIGQEIQQIHLLKLK